MIKWTTTTLKDGTAMLQGTVEGFPDAADAVQIWMCLLSEIVPLNWHMEWTRLRVEFWADSNRVLIYPESVEKSGFRKRAEKAICEVRMPLLGATFDKLLAESDNDEHVAAQMSELERRIAGALERAIGDVPGMEDIQVAFFAADEELPFAVSG